MRGRAYIGVSGFAYQGWVPRFYPEGTSSRDFLRQYAQRLETVEINYTFNRLPTDKTLHSWLEATPESFRFTLKAHQRITHEALLTDTTEWLPRFLERSAVLGRRLSCVLYQTPPWFRRDDERLAAFLEALPGNGPRAAFEFRHASWYEEPVYELLRRHDVALVTAEGEKAPAPFTVTAGFVYARLRSKDGPYTPQALQAWRERIVPFLEEGRDAYLYLYHDEAGQNALAAVELAGRLSV